MSRKELRRGEVIAKTVCGELTQRKVSQELQLSLRQVKRLVKRYKSEGLEGLAHRSRGKPSPRKINSSTREEVLELIGQNYRDFGPQLAKEQLESRHHLRFSREWVRRLMIEEGIWKVKGRKESRFYQRRERRSQEGELIQIDGSFERWFEKRGPKCCLINMVDDATGKIMDARFVEYECLQGYFEGMKNYIKTHGLPLAAYSDRHTIFKSQKSEGKPRLTQFGRALNELGISLIHARSAQAKGRVERSHGTLQDRLIKLMRLDGISTIEEGNKYLESFKEDYNRRFGRQPRSEESAHRELQEGISLDKVLCRKEQRIISKSLEVCYNHKTYQLIPQGNSRRLVGRKVQVSELADRVVIEVDGKEYDYKIYEDQPYVEKVLDHKELEVFLDRKRESTEIENRGMAMNF